MGFDANSGDRSLRNCGIKSDEFIRLVLPFSAMHDLDVGTPGYQTGYLHNGQHTTTNIECVVTQRRVAYANRNSIELEKEVVRIESESAIENRGADALRASRYGDLPLYYVDENINLANLAWRVK